MVTCCTVCDGSGERRFAESRNADGVWESAPDNPPEPCPNPIHGN